MAVEVWANDAAATVSSGGTTAPAAGTSESWTLSSSTLPAVSSSAAPPTQCYVADTASGAETEKVLVTNISGTTATVTRGADGTTPVTHASGFTIAQVLTRASLLGLQVPAGAVANIVSYGAVGDGATDNTAAFMAAIAAVTPADGVFDTAGTVLVPAGTFMTGPIVLPQRVGLAGVGLASTVKLSASAAANSVLVSNYQDAGATGNGAQGCFVSNLRLDGNNANRGSNWDSALVMTNTYSPTYPYEYSDARHTLSNVMVQYFTGDGIVISDSLVDNCNIWSIGGFGYVVYADANVSNCEAGGIGLDGYKILGSSMFANCKAWYCGSALTSSRGGAAGTAHSVTSPSNSWDDSGTTYSLANGFGNGFLINAGNFATLSGCYAQDNARSGFYVSQTAAVLSGCTADSNSNCGTSNGTSTGTAVGQFAGFDVPSGGSVINGISFDRNANVMHQAAGLHAYDTTGGQITLGFGGTLKDGSNMPPLISGDLPQGPALTMYAAFSGGGPGYIPETAITGTFAVDPFVAETWDITLSGNTTISNPALTGTNTTGAFLYQGQRLKFVVRPVGHTWTFGTAYKTTGTLTTTSGTVSIIEFIYDGTYWRQVAALVTMTS